jgi:hypothetical protein
MELAYGVIELTFLTTYTRSKLTYEPAYGFIIGDLNNKIEQIENHMFHQSKESIKEVQTPFYCLVSPPRHGKSLLLDNLFKNNQNVLVIEITYNSTTPTLLQEVRSVDMAIRFFWIRVLKSIMKDNRHMENILDSYNENQVRFTDVHHILNLARQKYSRSCIYKSNGEPKNIVICVDEFSNFLDFVRTGDEEKTEEHQDRFTISNEWCFSFSSLYIHGFQALYAKNTWLFRGSGGACFTAL